ncbi:DNA adenine methylase [Maledivibacter halophilus]|nr:DNA adenine methylase [Maledivibacter halophilus]
MLKPPIPRLGGKSRLRKKIISMLPEHKCYAAPFFGVGWVFFGKQQSKVEVINDIDGELMNLFKMIKYHAEEIDRVMFYEVSSRDRFNQYKRADIENLTEIQRAVRYIYIISQSFASKGGCYGYGTNTRPSPQIYNTEFLVDLKKRLRNTYIENLDYKVIFKKYDREWTFFFCDPPYLDTDIKFSSGCKINFDKEEHIKLSNILKNIKGKFLLTINDHPFIRELYEGFNVIETKVNYSVAKKSSSRKRYRELIITNYDVDYGNFNSEEYLSKVV